MLPGVFDEYFVGIALQDKTPLRKPINKALLAFMKTPEWAELQKRFIPYPLYFFMLRISDAISRLRAATARLWAATRPS